MEVLEKHLRKFSIPNGMSRSPCTQVQFDDASHTPETIFVAVPLGFRLVPNYTIIYIDMIRNIIMSIGSEPVSWTFFAYSW